MTPAELKTIRESLGLSVAWLAQQAGVQDRTVRYWESGHTPVPEDVAQMIGVLESDIENAVNQVMEQMREMIQQAGKPPESVALIRYQNDEDLSAFRPDMAGLPAACHAALISRVRRGLWSIRVPSVIQFMDPRAYHDWLDGRDDREDMRAEWAASLAT